MKPTLPLFGDSGPGLIFGAILLVMVLGGVGMFLLVRRQVRIRAQAAASGPMSTTSRFGKAIPGLVFGVFALVGLGLLFPLFVLPVSRILKARSWVEVPAVVVSSRVEEHRDSDGATYRPVIVYQYSHAGETHTSDRYGFLGGSSSGRAGKQAVVNRHPPGARVRCWVDPEHPTEAVLNREFTPELAFGLIPLGFALVGVGGLIAMLRGGRVPDAGGVRDGMVGDPEAARELRPKHGPVAKILGTLAVAAFWNGITWTIVVGALRDGDWFPLLFLSIFVLIGAGLLVALGYAVLSLANPRPRLTLRPGRLQSGVLQTLSWQMSGAVGRLRRMEFTLEGRESATYQRGTSTTTDRQTCVRIVLAELTGLAEMRAGETAFELPPEAVPGFQANHNRIEWFIRVKGEVPKWPDVNEEFPVEIAGGASDPAVAQAVPPGAALVRSADGALALGTEGARVAFAPGETLNGVAGWTLAAAPRSVEVRLFWYTQGKGTRDVALVETCRLDSPASQEVRPFAIPLPRQPWSVDGRLVSLVWALELVIEPGARSVRRELVLSPTGRPVRLPDAIADDPVVPGWLRRFKRRS